MLKNNIKTHSKNIEGVFFWIKDGELVALAESSDDKVKQYNEIASGGKKVSPGKLLALIETTQSEYKKFFESEVQTLKKRITLDEVSKQVCWHSMENRHLIPIDFDNIVHQYQVYGLVRVRSSVGSYETYKLESCLSDEFVINTVKEVSNKLLHEQELERQRTVGQLKAKVIAAKKMAEELDITLLEYLLILQNIEINRSKNERKRDLLFTHIDEEDLNDLIK